MKIGRRKLFPDDKFGEIRGIMYNFVPLSIYLYLKFL